MNRIRGLDAIRFVCAFWVMLSHFSVPVPFGHEVAFWPLKALFALLHASFSGIGAVMVFFVISGFCIHYPFRNGENPVWGEYYLRRYIRIGLPFLAITALVHFSGEQLTSLQDAVLWSLYAEMIYYGIYPLLMMARRRLGWTILLGLAYLGTASVVIAQPQIILFSWHGTALNWIMGLPCWLLGVRLAEAADTVTNPPKVSIWWWRFGIWAVSSIQVGLEFHSPFNSSRTMTLFAILVFFWLRAEIAYYRNRLPLQWLEKAGAWSYSLYLMHHPAEWVAGLLTVPTDPTAVIWGLKIVLALVLSYIFYLLVERPSHWLARQVKQKRSRKVKPPEMEGGPKEVAGEIIVHPTL